MKIYTEINYIWSEEEGKLIETSSKSYDYEGPMSLCHDKFEYIGPRRFNNKVRIPHGHQFDTPDDGPSESEQAQAAADKLKGQRDTAQAELETDLAEYDEDYFKNIGGKYTSFAMNAPVTGIRDQRRDAMRKLTAQLARQGKLNSSVRTDREALAKKLYGKGQVDAASRGHTLGREVEGKFNTAKGQAIMDIQNSANPASAADAALSGITAQTNPGTFNPILDVFLKLTQGLAMRQEVERRKERQAQNDSYFGKDSATYHP